MAPTLLSVKAYDAAGNVAQSSASLTLSPLPLPAPPVVTPQISPNPVTAAGNVTLSAAISAEGGVDRVEFLLDGVRVGLALVQPFAATLLNVTSAQNGIHTVTVRVTDQRGQVSEASQKLIIAIDSSRTQ